MRVCFFVNNNVWFDGNLDQFLKWVKYDHIPTPGETIQFDWGHGCKSGVFKIIIVVEEVTGTISMYAQTEFDK